MDISIFWAKFLGLYCVLLGIGMLVNSKQFKAFIIEAANNPLTIFFSGILALIFGLLIVITHNVWVGWPIIITVIGWVALIKGIIRLYFSRWLAGYISKFSENNLYYATVVICFILGLVLLYFGFVVSS